MVLNLPLLSPCSVREITGNFWTSAESGFLCSPAAQVSLCKVSFPSNKTFQFPIFSLLSHQYFPKSSKIFFRFSRQMRKKWNSDDPLAIHLRSTCEFLESINLILPHIEFDKKKVQKFPVISQWEKKHCPRPASRTMLSKIPILRRLNNFLK